MENSSDLMTIKEFAAASGRSQQTIYKQIGTRLASYVREIDGQKFIERKALAEVFSIGIQPEENNSVNSDNNPDNPLYAILRDELAAKNKQIEQLQNQVSELTQANKELAQSINKDRANELAGTLQQFLPEGASDGDSVPVEVFEAEEVHKPTQEPSDAQNGLLEAVRDLSWGEIIKTKFGRKRKGAVSR